MTILSSFNPDDLGSEEIVKRSPAGFPLFQQEEIVLKVQAAYVVRLMDRALKIARK
jgi:hypothetical protein